MTKHMSLEAQLAASKTQQGLLQSEIERVTLDRAAMKAQLEVGLQRASDAQEMAKGLVKRAEEERDRRVAEIEGELRDAETIRRKLHNTIQELKGELLSIRSDVANPIRQHSSLCTGQTCIG